MLNPPKKIDVVAASMVQMVDRSGGPWMAAECSLDGGYQKYNSNAGYVESIAHRMTPQVGLVASHPAVPKYTHSHTTSATGV